MKIANTVVIERNQYKIGNVSYLKAWGLLYHRVHVKIGDVLPRRMLFFGAAVGASPVIELGPHTETDFGRQVSNLQPGETFSTKPKDEARVFISELDTNLALPNTLPKGQAFQLRRVSFETTVSVKSMRTLTVNDPQLFIEKQQELERYLIEWQNCKVVSFLYDNRSVHSFAWRHSPFELPLESPTLIEGMHTFEVVLAGDYLTTKWGDNRPPNVLEGDISVECLLYGWRFLPVV